MGANLPRRYRPAGDREPVQRSDRGEAQLWRLGTALAVSFTVAVAGLAGLAGLAWVLLGAAGYRRHGAPALHDTVSVLQLVFATVAGAGALVALIVAYRRQKITEADSAHDRSRVFNERFTAIAAQLGDAQPAVRLAGVHAMAGLADDWRQNRQTCVDVLCAYLRLPYDPDPGEDADPAERTAYRANREVRHTIIRLISAHLRPGAAVSWQGLDFDFTGAVFDGGDFTAARFSSGSVVFTDAVFSGGVVRFDRAVFSGSEVGFTAAEFSGGKVSFYRAEFSGGHVSFTAAKFSVGEVSFHEAEFSGGVVRFDRAEFSGGTVRFNGAEFSDGEVSFFDAKFPDGKVSFNWAKFSGCQVSFPGTRFTGATVSFGSAEFSGWVDFISARFSSGHVSFNRAKFPDGKVSFKWAEFSGGDVSFIAAKFLGGEVNFGGVQPSVYGPVFDWDGKAPAGVVLSARWGL